MGEFERMNGEKHERYEERGPFFWGYFGLWRRVDCLVWARSENGSNQQASLKVWLSVRLKYVPQAFA